MAIAFYKLQSDDNFFLANEPLIESTNFLLANFKAFYAKMTLQTSQQNIKNYINST